MSTDTNSNTGHPTGEGEAPGEIDDLRRQLAKTVGTVERLSSTVRHLSAGRPALDHSDPPDVDDELVDVAPDEPGGVSDEELVVWVQWLAARYQLGDIIPACWAHHGALVEELDALRVGWLDTIGKGRGGLAGMQWHDYFGRALERMERRWRTRSCTDGHRDTTLPSWVTADPDTLDTPHLDGARYRPPAP